MWQRSVYLNVIEAMNRNWLFTVCSTSRARKDTKENWQKTDAKPTQGGGFHIAYGHVLDSNILQRFVKWLGKIIE